jgi:hypothetical protein
MARVSAAPTFMHEGRKSGSDSALYSLASTPSMMTATLLRHFGARHSTATLISGKQRPTVDWSTYGENRTQAHRESGRT